MSDAAGTVIVDDQPTGNILQYNGEWSHLYSLASAVNNTLSYTATAGNSVILKFNGAFSTPDSLNSEIH